MNLDDDQILEILEKYRKDSKMKYAVLLDGEWGSGKTYLKNTEKILK